MRKKGGKTKGKIKKVERSNQREKTRNIDEKHRREN